MESNPLALMYGWQPLLCAAAAVGVTKLVKTVLDLAMGTEARKASRIVSKIVLPLTPIVIGLLYGAFVPLRPEVLVDYVAEHVEGTFMTLVAFAAWGAACGQFSTMLHQKFMDFLQHGKPE